MSTPTTDPTHDQLTQLFTAIAESAPDAPDVSDIVRGPGLRVAVPIERHRSTRWIASAAAIAIALGGGLVWSIRGDSGDSADRADPIDTQQRLETLLLPTAIPDGWQLVDISEYAPTANETTSSLRAWVIVEAGGATRGVLTVSGPANRGVTTDTVFVPAATEPTLDGTETTTPPVVEPTPGEPTGDEVGSWVADQFWGQGSLWWQADGFYLSLTVNSGDEGLVRSLQTALQIDISGDKPQLTIDPASGYTIEKDLGAVHDPPSPGASLTYLDADGKQIQISVSAIPVLRIEALVDPNLDESVPVAAVVPGADGLVSGRIVRGDMLTGFNSASGSHHSAAEALSVLASMSVVGASAWDTATAAITQRIGAEPIIGSGDVFGGELTIHDGALLDGICFTASSGTSCRWEPPDVVPPSSDEFVSADLLAGDRWINVTRLPADASTDPVQIERMSGSAGFDCASEQPGPAPDCGRGIIDRAVVTTNAGTFVVLSAPVGVTDMTVSVGAVDNRALAEQRFVRPLR